MSNSTPLKLCIQIFHETKIRGLNGSISTLFDERMNLNRRHKTQNCAMQGVSHLGERRTMLHDGVERFLFPFIRSSRYSRRAPPRRRIGEKRKKRRKIFSPRRKSKITVLFFEQHRRGRTSSQAYSKSWCKLSKSRAHTHTHTQVWENNRKRWSLCVCTIHTLPPRSTLFVKWHRWLAIEYCDISMLCIGFSPISPSTPLFFFILHAWLLRGEQNR